MKKKSWIIKQRKEVSEIFNPKVDYDKEYDILSITWFPKADCKYSLETQNGFVFDLTKKDFVKGVEIFNFKQRFIK